MKLKLFMEYAFILLTIMGISLISKPILKEIGNLVNNMCSHTIPNLPLLQLKVEDSLRKFQERLKVESTFQLYFLLLVVMK